MSIRDRSKELIRKAVVWFCVTVAAVVVALMVTRPLQSGYDQWVKPLFCDADRYFEKWQVLHREGEDLRNSAVKNQSQSNLDQSVVLFTQAREALEGAFDCGSMKAAEVLVLSHCSGANGFEQDRELGIGLLRDHLTPSGTAPSGEMIDEFCPL